MDKMDNLMDRMDGMPGPPFPLASSVAVKVQPWLCVVISGGGQIPAAFAAGSLHGIISSPISPKTKELPR